MSYYSDALQEMDKNTVQYMIEVNKAKIEENQKIIENLEANTEREKNRADAAEQKAQEIGLSNIKNLMRNLGFTAEQAMQALNISEADRQVFRAQL